MLTRRPRLAAGLALMTGLGLGWMLGTGRAPRLHAGGADRWGERIVATGPILVEPNGQKMPVPRDAIYYLNYHNGLLLATVPTLKQVGNASQVVAEFAERDLVRDFNLGPGVTPHFLMTTGSLGAGGEGWAPLFVFETETGQMATYRLMPQAIGNLAPAGGGSSNKPSFQLLERRSDPRLGRNAPPPGSAAAR